ncbi:MAG: hypothetical protein ACKOC8_09365 [Pirellulales bacterium]
MRFFRGSPAIYEQVRQSLDSAWGNPSENGTVTCIEPEATAPHDNQGRVLLGVNNEFCEFPAVAEILPQLLASGAVEEISEATYRASLPQPMP